MLRIDETSRTLVATAPPSFVPEPAPAREELLELVTAGWELFAGEIGQPHLRFVAGAPAPGADLLAFDATAGRIALITLADEVTAEVLGRALAAAATVAAWDAAALAEVHEDLEAAVPHDSPQLVLVVGTAGATALATLDFLARRHGVHVSAHLVRALRLGTERHLEIVPAYPAAEPVAEDAPAFVAAVASPAPAAGTSTPPPGVPAA
jgi:hypothetical protein